MTTCQLMVETNMDCDILTECGGGAGLGVLLFSSQILFFGAEFTKLYAKERRARVLPVPGAEAVSEEAKDRERGNAPDRSNEKKAT